MDTEREKRKEKRENRKEEGERKRREERKILHMAKQSHRRSYRCLEIMVVVV